MIGGSAALDPPYVILHCQEPRPAYLVARHARSAALLLARGLMASAACGADLLYGDGIHWAGCFACTAAYALVLVDPQPVVVKRIAFILCHRFIARDDAVFIFQQRGYFYDTTLHRFDVDALIAEDALRVDDLEFVMAQITA